MSQKSGQYPNNGNLKPIDDINKMSFGFVVSKCGKPWEDNQGPVKAMLGAVAEHENGGQQS